MSDPVDLIVNIILIGNANVGKTNLVYRYINNEFNEGLPSTIGLDYLYKLFNQDGQNLNVKFWDTAGQEKYKSLIKKIYK